MSSAQSSKSKSKYPSLPWMKPGVPIMLGMALSLLPPPGFTGSYMLAAVQSLSSLFTPLKPQIIAYSTALLQIMDSIPLISRFANFLRWVDASEAPVSSALSLPLTDLHSVLFMISLYCIIVPILASVIGLFFPKSKSQVVKTKPQPSSELRLKPGILPLIGYFHNNFLIFLSSFMMTEALYQAFAVHKYSFVGNQSPGDTDFGIATIIWIFYFSKTIEWVDTLLIILNRNWRQLSFLHVYHHSSIFLIWWFIAKSSPGGDAYYCVFLNSLVHVIMYTYYLFRSYGLSIWFKFYITQFQMFQFITMMLHARYDIYYQVSPVWLFQLQQWYMPSLLILFGHFYITNKSKPKRQKESKKNI